MYDATGVRLHAGRQAEVAMSAARLLIFNELYFFPTSLILITYILQVLNQIVYGLPAEHPLAESRPLRELLGHTPPQVRKNDLCLFWFEILYCIFLCIRLLCFSILLCI